MDAMERSMLRAFDYGMWKWRPANEPPRSGTEKLLCLSGHGDVYIGHYHGGFWLVEGMHAHFPKNVRIDWWMCIPERPTAKSLPNEDR